MVTIDSDFREVKGTAIRPENVKKSSDNKFFSLYLPESSIYLPVNTRIPILSFGQSFVKPNSGTAPCAMESRAYCSIFCKTSPCVPPFAVLLCL